MAKSQQTPKPKKVSAKRLTEVADSLNRKSIFKFQAAADVYRQNRLKDTSVVPGLIKSSQIDKERAKRYEAIVKKATAPKATTDSTKIYKAKAYDAVRSRATDRDKNIKAKASPAKRASDDAKAVQHINNMNQAVARQKLKGKPGYDANGYPKKK